MDDMDVEDPPIGDDERLAMQGVLNDNAFMLDDLYKKGTIDERFFEGIRMYINVLIEAGENPNNIPDDQKAFILGRHIEGTIQKQLRIYQVLKHYEDIVSDGEEMKRILDILIDLSGKLDKPKNEETYKTYKKYVTDEINNTVSRVLPGIRQIYDDFVRVKIPVHFNSLFNYYVSVHMDGNVKAQYELFKNDEIFHREGESLVQGLYNRKCDDNKEILSIEAITALFLEGGRRRKTRSRKTRSTHKKTARRRKNRYRKRSKTIKGTKKKRQKEKRLDTGF